MQHKIACVFPGQGAQHTGMGKDFYDHSRIAKETFQEADDLLSFSLSDMIFSDDEHKLMQTKYAQPAIFVVSLAMLRTIQQEMPEIAFDFAAGLSLGEYSALVASEKISFADCLELVRWRGCFMHEASIKYPGTMLAVLGLEEKVIIDAGYWISNVNSPGQVVIAGGMEEMAEAREELLEIGAKRVIPIKVAGAFHSPLMDEAKEKMTPLLARAHIKESTIHLVMNVVGAVVDHTDDIKQNLMDQVSAPTRWVDCMECLEECGVDLYMEIGPKQLYAMNRKIVPAEKLVTISKWEEMEGAYEKISR